MSTEKADAGKPAPTPAAPAKQTAEQWAKEKETPAWLFAATRAKHKWPVGKELTEAEFDAACTKAANVRIGG